MQQSTLLAQLVLVIVQTSLPLSKLMLLCCQGLSLPLNCMQTSDILRAL